jgi:hypothetical protein
MQLARYAIERHLSHWVVSVDGQSVLACKTKRTALKAARRAMVLLHQSQPAELPHQEPERNSNDNFLSAPGRLTTAEPTPSDARRG